MKKMKSKIKTITYFPSIIVVAIFTSMFIGATITDNPFVFNSLIWWIVAIFLLGLIYMILKAFKNIPQITILNDTVQSEAKKSNIKINIADIEKIERVQSKINGWYSKRGGLQIYTEKDMLVFPYHVYSNETQMLKLIYQREALTIKRNYSFSFENFYFIKYFYRSFGSFLLVMALSLVAVLISKDEITIIGIVGISLMVLPMITVFLMHSKFLKVENGYLYHISPLLLKSCKYDFKNIEYANSESISTGRGAVKNLTIELIDKQILTLIGGLNKQKSIDKIREKINTRSNITS